MNVLWLSIVLVYSVLTLVSEILAVVDDIEDTDTKFAISETETRDEVVRVLAWILHATREDVFRKEVLIVSVVKDCAWSIEVSNEYEERELICRNPKPP